MDFEKAFTEVGPLDRGYYVEKRKEYYEGISRKEYPQWEGWHIIDSMKHKLSFPQCLVKNRDLYEQVLAFYKRYYWDIFDLDKVSSYAIAREIYQHAIEFGVFIAFTNIQNVCNVLNVDNIYGPDLFVDAKPGNKSRARFVQMANTPDVQNALLKGLHCTQGYRIIQRSCSPAKPSHDCRKYTKGWLSKRNEGYTYE